MRIASVIKRITICTMLSTAIFSHETPKQDDSSSQDLKSLITQFLKEDFEYLADEGDVRYEQSIYTKEHMAKERKIGKTGIQCRSARVVDVPHFNLVNSWKLLNTINSGDHGQSLVEFNTVLIASYNRKTGYFEFMRPQQPTEKLTINAIRKKERWYIKYPPPLHLSVSRFRERLSREIIEQENILKREINRTNASKDLSLTISIRSSHLKIMRTNLERLDELLAQPPIDLATK